MILSKRNVLLFLITLSMAVMLLLPAFVFAQGTYNFEFADSKQGCEALSKAGATFTHFSQCIVDLVAEAFVPYIIALTVLAFLVGVFWYVRNSGDENKRAESIRLIVWSLIGIFFMITVWAFSFMFAHFFGLDPKAPQVIPQFGGF